MSSERRLICIDARLTPGMAGGVQQAIAGLHHGLCALTDGAEEYLFSFYEGALHWLAPHHRCRHIELGNPPDASARGRIKGSLPILSSALHALPQVPGLRSRIDRSEGTLERLGTQLVHFAAQGAFLTTIPSIYQPHDLQHVHWPQFFSRRTIDWRNRAFRAFSDQATLVVVMTNWGKRDLVDTFGLDPDKVRVVPWASFLGLLTPPDEKETARISRSYDLPNDFFLYPAQTWPHKNHLAAIEALAILRDEHGCDAHLICTGATNSFYPKIRARIDALQLSARVRFLGYVETDALQVLYARCRALVYPSLFEGWGIPIVEAFAVGKPVLCAKSSCLPEVTGGAAVLFDPLDHHNLAEQMHLILNDDAVRKNLVQQGTARSKMFSWDRTARTFRALYREILGADRSAQDEELIARSQGGP